MIMRGKWVELGYLMSVSFVTYLVIGEEQTTKKNVKRWDLRGCFLGEPCPPNPKDSKGLSPNPSPSGKRE